MKDFKKQYYIENVPWKRKLDYDKIKRFEDINYDNTVIFNFDFTYSVFKIKATGYNRNSIFISAINVCLRYYHIIKNLYSHNNVRVIIYVKKDDSNYEIFKSILNLIPNFAVCDDSSLINKFDNKNYKHIIYGSCNNLVINNTEKQKWSVIVGNLNVR